MGKNVKHKTEDKSPKKCHETFIPCGIGSFKTQYDKAVLP